jgi:hypothetical protein
MIYDFWSAPDRWPMDPNSYIFLARAVSRIGEAMFGPEWTGTETTTKIFAPSLRELNKSSPAERIWAYQALMRGSRKYRKKHTAPVARYTPSSLIARHLTPGEWKEAQTIIRQEYEAAGPALQRFAAVQREITKRCESGELISAIRAKDGGMRPVSSQWWNTDNAHARFAMCQLNPKEPFSVASAGDNFCWIFLNIASLERFLLAQPFTMPEAGIDVHLSPYLKTMLSVAKKLEIKSDCQPKKQVIIAELQASWPGSTPLSQNLASAMATLLREPESQAGRAIKPNKTRAKRK